MSVTETKTLDMVAVLTLAGEIGEMINASRELDRYLFWKDAVSGDEAIQKKIREFARKKEKFSECERFGHFHPDYHAALEEVRQAEAELDRFEAVRQFKEAEKELDELLYAVSETIARAVSEDIKVPGNDPLPRGGCGSGGKCNCG